MFLALASVAWSCTWYVYDDFSDGSADGYVEGGTFVPGGWRPDGGFVRYDLPDLVSATITMRLSNVDEASVSQSDLLELFSGTDGSFSDSRRDNFLQVKFAGDIYEGYDGRVKLQAGPELYGDAECGAWTSEFDWDPSGSYDFTVSYTQTSAALDVGGGLLSASIDATPCDDLGPLTFRTLRVPNDGNYARDPLMDDIIIAGVGVCGDDATSTPVDTGGGQASGDSGTPDGDSGGTSEAGGGGAGDSAAPTGGDTGRGEGARPNQGAPPGTLTDPAGGCATTGGDAALFLAGFGLLGARRRSPGARDAHRLPGHRDRGRRGRRGRVRHR